jgi:hypothetical protein
VLFLYHWRAGNATWTATGENLCRALSSLERRLELGSGRQAAALRALEETQGMLRAGVESMLSLLQGHESPGESVPGLLTASAEQVSPRENEEALDVLPALPEGLAASDLLRKIDLKQFFADPAFNPRGKILSRVERARALSEVDCARARIEILHAEARVAVTEAIEKLRERGEYIDYASGERYETEQGVITAGEEIEGAGTRLFYLRREEFPAIYERREEAKQVAQTALRRLLSLTEEPSSTQGG